MQLKINEALSPEVEFKCRCVGNSFALIKEARKSTEAMMHSKVKKQVDLNKHLLCQELDKVKKIEKIELKMIETSRRRFRLKYKKDKLTHFGVKATEEHAKEEPSNPSEDLDAEKRMRIHEEKVMNRISEMIFTEGEVDIEKLLCLHLLTAQEISTDNNTTDAVSPVSKKVSEVSTRLDAESKYNLNNPWNETLPCYIVQIKADESIIRKKLEQEYVAQLDQEGKAIYDLEVQCRKYAENNEEFNRALQSRLHAPISFGMIPTISEQLYKSLQGSPCERSELFTDRPSSAKSEKKQTSLPKLNVRKPFMINAFQPSEACLDAAKRKPKHYLYFDASFNFNKMKKAKIKLTSLSVNNELKILVQLVLEVLQTVHIEKVNQFLEIIRDPKKINTTLIKPKVKLFLRSCKDSNIVSSSENYVLISGLAKEENNASIKNKFQNKLIAETLETQAIVELDDLLAKIRKELKIKVENEYNSNVLLKNENVQTSESNLKDTNKKKHLRQSSAEANINETVKKLHNYQEPKEHKQVDSSRSINKDELKVTNNIKTQAESDSSKNSITKQSSTVPSTSNQILSSSQSDYKKILEEKQLNVNQDVGYFDPDKVILRRMTNEQRILVGQMCASLKTKKINSQGLLREKVPLAALITPVLSHESIKRLTKGTIYAKEEEEEKKPEEVKIESEVISEKLTDSLISKLRHKIAESETQRKLEKFMKKGI